MSVDNVEDTSHTTTTTTTAVIIKSNTELNNALQSSNASEIAEAEHGNNNTQDTTTDVANEVFVENQNFDKDDASSQDMVVNDDHNINNDSSNLKEPLEDQSCHDKSTTPSSHKTLLGSSSPNPKKSNKQLASENVKIKAQEQKVEEEQPSIAAATTTNGSAAATVLRPVKRARTAYFIFTDEKRPLVQKEHVGESVGVIAKIMGQMWATLSAEEKQIYQEKAAVERERVAQDMAVWKEQHKHDESSNPVSQNTNAEINKDAIDAFSSCHLLLPIAKIRKISKLDPDVKNINKEAIQLIAKATELFTTKLGKETVRVAQIQNRRKLLPEDVAQVCAAHEVFAFLREDVRDLTRQQQKLAQESAAAKKKQPSTKSAETGINSSSSTKPLTAYFASTTTAAASSAKSTA